MSSELWTVRAQRKPGTWVKVTDAERAYAMLSTDGKYLYRAVGYPSWWELTVAEARYSRGSLVSRGAVREVFVPATLRDAKAIAAEHGTTDGARMDRGHWRCGSWTVRAQRKPGTWVREEEHARTYAMLSADGGSLYEAVGYPTGWELTVNTARYRDGVLLPSGAAREVFATRTFREAKAVAADLI